MKKYFQWVSRVPAICGVVFILADAAFLACVAIALITEPNAVAIPAAIMFGMQVFAPIALISIVVFVLAIVVIEVWGLDGHIF